MIGLVDVVGSGPFALSDIKRIRRIGENEHGVDKHAVTLQDGQERTLYQFELDDVMVRPVQLIPADPGTRFCRVFVKPAPAEVFTDPVIAWALCMDGQIRPVTPGGVNDGCPEPDDGVFIQMPNGEVRSVGDSGDVNAFDNVDAMLAHFVARANGEQTEADKRIAALRAAEKEQGA